MHCVYMIQALQLYSSIVDQYPDLAITDYARLDRALMLFQNGNRSRVRRSWRPLPHCFTPHL